MRNVTATKSEVMMVFALIISFALGVVPVAKRAT